MNEESQGYKGRRELRVTAKTWEKGEEPAALQEKRWN